MKSAIYCPGPSLLKIKRQIGYDLTIAVNMALKVCDADWLSAGDCAFFNGLLGNFRPKVGYITCEDNVKTAQKEPEYAHYAFVLWSEIPQIDEHKRSFRPINWSLQAALCFAAHNKCTETHVYGCDLSGIEDATGYAGEDRSGDRWTRERNDLDFTTKLLTQHGMQTVFIK